MKLTEIISVEKVYDNYLVDCENGRVYSKRKGDFLKGTPNSNGYVYNTIVANDGTIKGVGVHVLVMSSYHKIPLEQFKRGMLEVDHINEDLKHVNSFNNLQITSRKGQYKESTRQKIKNARRVNLNEKVVKEMLIDYSQWEAEGKKRSDFIHNKSIELDQGYRNLFNIVTGRSWKHLHNAN